MNKKVRMFQALLIVTIILLQIVIPIVPSIAVGETETIQFEDVNLYNAIKEELGDKVKSSSDENLTITLLKNDIEGITKLYLSSKKITNISGIEHFTNLTELYISQNQISDISALSSLSNLTRLWSSRNQISDISALSSLTNLTDLNLDENQISDISALSSLTNLTKLDLYDNQISDISALSSLTNLTYLLLFDNLISDISALSSLTKLTTLRLGSNKISDISALSSLTNLTYLSLGENQISDISAISGLTSLTSLTLWYNKISDISAISGLTNLTGLYLGGNQISKISDIGALSGLTNLTSLDLGENQISDISDISAISGLTNLTNLYLSRNQISKISDIGALSGLTNLTTLNLAENQISKISDISAISGLTSLTGLELYNNQISDISDIGVLSGLTNLTTLNLSKNQISDISDIGALSGLTNLTNLYLSRNQIRKHISNTEEEIELPPIFIQAKDKNSRIYTEKEYGLSNCELSEDGTKVKLIDKEKNAFVTIYGGEAYHTEFGIIVEPIKLDYIRSWSLPRKTEYTEGENFDSTGMGSIIVIYNDRTEKEIKKGDYTILNGENLKKGQKSVTISYTEGDVTLTEEIDITVKEKTPLQETIQFADVNLYNAIKEKLGDKVKSSSDESLTITLLKSDIEGITDLSLGNKEITNISGIEHFTNLTYLNLSDNQISDISAISGLTNLTELHLSGNQITKNISNTEEEIELPQIFIQAKDENSKIYTEQEYILENCELSEDKTKVKLIDKKQNASVKIAGGYADGTLFTIVVESETPKTLDSIKITKAPSKVEYTEGENFDKTGMEVTACYSDGTEQVITNYTVTNGENLKKGQTSVTISYTEGEVTKEIAQAITVKEKEQENPKGLKVEIKTYKEETKDNTKYITSIQQKTTIEDFIKNIETNGTITIKKEGKEITNNDEKIGTGMIIEISLKEEKVEYILVVRGDLTGDGLMSEIDLLRLARYRVGLDTTLREEHIRAADIYEDKKYADDLDLLKMARILVGLDSL